MSNNSSLTPELRKQMDQWVMDYIHRRTRSRHRLTIAGLAVVATVSLIGASAWVVLERR